jgi:hypothetical protein
VSIPRFYLDADSSRKVLVRALRASLIDVQTAREAGLLFAKDPPHVAHVLATGRILVTGDHRLRREMIEITQQGGHHAGLVFLDARRRSEIANIVFSFQLIHAASSAEEMVDRIEFIPF